MFSTVGFVVFLSSVRSIHALSPIYRHIYLPAQNVPTSSKPTFNLVSPSISSILQLKLNVKAFKMTPRHDSNPSKCSHNVRIPPLNLWTTTDVVAFPNDHEYIDTMSKCCGETTKITLYNKECARFCSTSGNTTEVFDCMQDAGLNKTTSFHNDKGGKKNAASLVSKPAMGLVMMVVGSLVVGTI